MKKIITAIGNEYLNLELKKYNCFQIDIGDIQYKEGIIETLENNEKIDFIIINDLLPGEINTVEIIKSILDINSKIKIILFLEEKDEFLEKQLYNNGVYKILFNSQISINELIKILNEPKVDNEELKEEINNLKRIILEKENNKINLNKKEKIKLLKINNIIYKFKNRIVKIQESILSNKTNNIKNNKGKIICILGPDGVGKSIFSINLSKINFYSNKKILIIDLDIFNKSIQTILGVKSNNQKSNIIKINKKLDLLIYNEFLTNNKLENNIENYLINSLEKIKNNYDYIIIDTSSNFYNNGIITKISDINIFLSDTNFLEISKSIKILDVYINKLKIKKEKILTIFNKINKNSIDINLLKKIFSEFKIIGNLSYSENYNKLINKNNKRNLINKKIRREYLKINNEINKII